MHLLILSIHYHINIPLDPNVYVLRIHISKWYAKFMLVSHLTFSLTRKYFQAFLPKSKKIKPQYNNKKLLLKRIVQIYREIRRHNSPSV